MIYIFLLGFALPWILGVYLYKKAPAILLTAAPATALIAVTINQLGIHLGLWKVNPMPRVILMDSIFLDLGIFPVIGVWFSYLIHAKKYKRIWVYLGFILGMTGLEYGALLKGTVSYNEDWNIFFTLLVYVGGFVIIDVLLSKLEKLKALPSQ